ncbi:MAG: TIGR00366 family protein [bacterium]
MDPGKAVLAFADGDGWTNMLQPFWALPLLALTGLKARQIIGYSAALMLLVAPIYLVALAVF